MDFQNSLRDQINATVELPDGMRLRNGFLSANESLVLYPLPGSRVIEEYMDEMKDEALNYEIAMKSKDSEKVADVLWRVQDYLSQVSDVVSSDNSFQFLEIVISSKPYGNEADEQQYFTMLLDFQANITNFGR